MYKPSTLQVLSISFVILLQNLFIHYQTYQNNIEELKMPDNVFYGYHNNHFYVVEFTNIFLFFIYILNQIIQASPYPYLHQVLK